MTKPEKVRVVTMLTITTAALIISSMHTRRQRAIRAEIIANTKRELNAIAKAAVIMQEKISSGHYDGKWQDAQTDLDFHIIAAHYE